MLFKTKFIPTTLFIDREIPAHTCRSYYAYETGQRFRGIKNFVVDAKPNTQLLVRRLCMGQTNLLSMPCSAQVFAPDSTVLFVPHISEVLDTGMVSLDVENATDESIPFTAQIFGDIEDGEQKLQRAKQRARWAYAWRALKDAALVPPRVLFMPVALLWWLTAWPFRALRRLFAAKHYTLIGFESANAMGPGIMATVSARPQLPFKGVRLVLPAADATAWTILDIRVGNSSHTASSSALPGGAFSANAIPIDLDLATAQISQDITLTVQNVSNKPRTFRALMHGRIGRWR